MKAMKEKKNQQVHEEVLELLPWLINDTLEGKERLRVLNHLNDCRSCQLERDRLQALGALVQSSDDDIGDNYKPGFDKLMARIAESEASEPTTSETSETGERPNVSPQRSRQPLLLGVAASVCILLSAVVLMPSDEMPVQITPPAAETLSIPKTTGLANQMDSVTHRLTIAFDRNADAATLRTAFIQSGAYIVSGPDQDGRYVIEVVKPLEVANSELLESMSALEGVRYVALLD